MGEEVTIRVDANEGYSLDEVLRFYEATGGLGIELVEQPIPASATPDLKRLGRETLRSIAVDESLHTERDALKLTRSIPDCGIFNVKLMKCGGITSARNIASIAETGGQSLMWGCMDESAISIAAALHTAYSCPGTRFLDLDGSFDLSRDPATGGFRIVSGKLMLVDEPGLGVRLRA